MSAGNFDCGKLIEIKVKADQVWADNMATSEFKAEVDALNTIISNQRGFNLVQLQDMEKDNTVKVSWLNDCAEGEVDDCSDECTVSGNEIGDDCKTYELDICKEISFKVAEKKWRGSIWSKEEVIARAMLSKMKQLEENIVQTVVAKLDTYTGVNQELGGYSFVGTDTVIPAAHWTPAMFAYLTRVAIKNRMRDAYILSGSNLFDMAQMAAWNSGNADGKGAQAAITSMPKYFDLFNIDSVLGERKTFLIRPSAVAFVNKNYYGSAPVEFKGKAAQIRYSVPSNNLSGVTFDVIYDTECTSNEIYHKWRLMFKGALLLNPASCDGERKGVLSFVCE
jgi:hypothetical protein